MKVILPMAGRGSRFADNGYVLPKPIIPVAGRPMIFHALDSIANIDYTDIIFILLREHEDMYQISTILTSYPTVGKKHFVYLDGVTEGQLCTVLAAKHLFNDQDDVLIMASDTYIISDIAQDIADNINCAGIISVANLPGEQWSFAAFDKDLRVSAVAEKKRISDWASTGLYYFSSGKQLITTGEDMIADGKKVRGEYYIMPVYQELIQAGCHITVSFADAMWDMGNPVAKEAFELYLNNNLHGKS